MKWIAHQANMMQLDESLELDRKGLVISVSGPIFFFFFFLAPEISPLGSLLSCWGWGTPEDTESHHILQAASSSLSCDQLEQPWKRPLSGTQS